MHNNFMLFTDLQKRLTPSPIKSWRLLKQLRDEGHMREPDDWIMQDRKLLVNVPRFIVELERLGYGNMKSDDITNGSVISGDIKELIDEMKLISSEITERSIQEEMKSNEISTDETKRKIEEEDVPVKSSQQNLKSNDTTASNLKSDEITFASREIIEAKNEVIDTLKGSVADKGNENTQLHKLISELSEQNKKLTQQNAWLTNLLVAPKAEPEPERARNVKVTDISDITDEMIPEDDMSQSAQAPRKTAHDAADSGDAPAPAAAEQSTAADEISNEITDTEESTESAEGKTPEQGATDFVL
jgi:hypothetical protein